MSSSDTDQVVVKLPTQDGGPGIALSKPTTHIDEHGRQQFKPSREFFLAFSALMVIILAVAFDATTLSVALPKMSTELGGTALEAFWSGTSFLLASSVFQPTFASLSSIFGRKYLIYVCAVFFAAGSLIGAVAKSFTVVIVGRTIQGTGGGGLIALSEVVVTDLVPLAFRGQWFSLLSAIWAVGTVAGPLIGAGFAQRYWPGLFWINIPIIVVGTGMVIFFLKQTKIPGGIAQKVRRFDYTGSFLFTVGSTSMLFGVTTGGVMYEWDSWRTLVPLILGIAIIVVFGVWEVKFAAEPLINKGIFNNWTTIANYILTTFHGIILWSLVYVLTLYYQGVKFYRPITAALAVLPETLTVAPAGMIVGIVASKTGHYRWALWTGWVLTTLGAGLLYLLKPDTTVPQWIFLNLPIGIGTGMLFPAMALGIQAACEPALNGQAAAFFSFLRTFGQGIGVAISGVIFQNAFKNELLELPAFAARAHELSRDGTHVVEMIKQMEASEQKDQLVNAYNEALRVIWLALLGFAGVSLIISLTVKGYSLNQEHVTEQHLVEDKKTEKDIESGADR